MLCGCPRRFTHVCIDQVERQRRTVYVYISHILKRLDCGAGEMKPGTNKCLCLTWALTCLRDRRYVSLRHVQLCSAQTCFVHSHSRLSNHNPSSRRFKSWHRAPISFKLHLLPPYRPKSSLHSPHNCHPTARASVRQNSCITSLLL